MPTLLDTVHIVQMLCMVLMVLMVLMVPMVPLVKAMLDMHHRPAALLRYMLFTRSTISAPNAI